MTTHRVYLAAGLLAAALALPRPAAADGFSTTNVQLLQGYNFHDNLLGYDTKSGTMTTVTLNHFSTWEYGDNFAFVDLYRGDFVDGLTPTGSTSDVYAEWHPRLFLNKLLGLGAAGPIRNWGLAGEINQSRDFSAYLGGFGVDLALPGFAVAGVNLYYRYSNATVRLAESAGTFTSLNFYHHTWQLSPFWTVPFGLGPLQLVFTGFADLTTDRIAGKTKLDLMAQPELLLDLGALVIGGKPGRFHAGVEWYVHAFPNPGRDGAMKVVSVPQAMVQWTVH